MDLSEGISLFFEQTPFKNWFPTKCLEYLENKSLDFRTSDKELVQTEFKSHVHSLMNHKAVTKSAQKKAKRLLDEADLTFESEEVIAIFKRMDTKLLFVKKSLFDTEVQLTVEDHKIHTASSSKLHTLGTEIPGKASKRKREIDDQIVVDGDENRAKKTGSGRDIPSYREFLGKTSVSDIIVKGNEEENVIQYNEKPTSQSDNDSGDHEEYQDYEKNVSDYEECFEEEIPSNMASADTIGSWILSSGKDVGEELSKYREYIPRTKAYLYPVYFGILDLSGEDTEVKNLFTNDEWNEMIKDFNNNVKLSDMEDEQERPFYELMDKISEVLMKKPTDLITGIESCVIEDNIKVNTIRRLIQTYTYNLQRLQLPMSEVAFGSNFTNAITKGILTFDRIYHYEEGEIQGLALSVITNMKSRPTDRSLIGQKVDFRVSKDQFEMLIGLRSGGLPASPKSKKWMDKVDLSVALRDVLINEGIENNGVKPEKFRKLFTLGIHTFNYNYNIYGLDWKTRGVWRLGLLQKVKLPLSIDNLHIIEKLIISLMRIEAKLYRFRRTSTYVMDYLICEYGRITRTRKAKEQV
ncbi:12255_t:CDS:10 [Funneliformis caledonium]|uniref:12255_t:CDS:1 n=1 Tax=Funneliformis caledonium TaxID=1117310 RepID=A0A9N9ABQ1_9GLOM|nr:12255_t:CDS:10 [Funneliformis caledonium]